MKSNLAKGYLLLELIIGTVIIGIVFATGSVLISSSTQNYIEQKKLQSGYNIINININRLQNYLEPIFKQFYMPLYRTTNGEQVIFAISNNQNSQILDPNNTYMSQLVKVSLASNEIVLETYSPSDNGGIDTLYPNSTNFNDLTNLTLTSTSTTIAKNVSSLDISYLDLNGALTEVVSEISFISIQLNLFASDINRERTIYIAPWRLLL